MLMGTSVLPSHVTIKGKQFQLGDVVRRAFKDSGLSIDEWNNLSERDRDIKLVDAFYDMRNEE